MKINLPVFKDEDMRHYHLSKLALGPDSVSPCVVQRLAPFSPMLSTPYKAIQGELLRSLGTDITLDGILTILDEHYNNVKALNALNQELFQLQMGEKETVSDWGVHLLRHHQILVASFLEHFPQGHITELKCEPFYTGLPKWFKAMVAYLKASADE